MIRLRQWFERSVLGQQYFSRSRSDQRIIAIVSLLLAVSLLWFLLWKPVSDWHEDATTRMAQAQSTLDYVKSNEAAARKAGSGKSDDASLIPLVTRAANAQDVTIGRLQPESGGILSVVLEGQAFDKVYRWIAQLEQNNGVVARWVSIRGEERQGYVSAQVRFTAAGSP